MWHAQWDGTCSQGGAFDLSATQYRDTCADRRHCLQELVPPWRFWQYDDWNHANNGCQPANEQGHIRFGNAGYDWPPSLGNPGHWLLQSDWKDPRNDGCPTRQRTVADVSDVDASREASPDHGAWYLLTSVEALGSYDFDRILGATAILGCLPGAVPALPVPGLRIVNRTAACAGAPGTVTLGTRHSTCDFFTVGVTLDDPAPPYFTEQGLNDPVHQLIAGYQIVYAVSATDPVTSRLEDGLGNPVWKPALDPTWCDSATSPPGTRLLSVVPYGTGQVDVAIPYNGGATAFLAARIVYSDCSRNGSTDRAASCGTPDRPANPLASLVSGHCGPVQGL